MLKRTITASLILIVMLPVCLFADTWVLPIVIALCALIAAYEMLGCVGTRKYPAIAVPAFLLAAVGPICARLLENTALYTSLYATIAFFFCFVLLSAGVFSRGALEVEPLFVSFASMFYVTTGFTAIVLLANRPFGVYFVLLTMFGPWISDVFAYLTGKFLGKHKLIPSISPNKTVEGTVGGIVFTALFTVGYGAALMHIVDDVQTANYLPLAFAGAGVSVIAQIGDLIMSYIKRKYGIKDFGNLLPGHGGILDRFDSVLAVAPFSLLLTEFQEYLQFFA